MNTASQASLQKNPTDNNGLIVMWQKKKQPSWLIPLQLSRHILTDIVSVQCTGFGKSRLSPGYCPEAAAMEHILNWSPPLTKFISGHDLGEPGYTSLGVSADQATKWYESNLLAGTSRNIGWTSATVRKLTQALRYVQDWTLMRFKFLMISITKCPQW